MTRPLSWWPIALLAAALVGCDDGGSSNLETDGDPAGADGGTPDPQAIPAARFALAEEGGATPLGDIPFPSDLYRAADGRLDLRGFPNQGQDSILERIVAAIEDHTEGFGTSATLYMAFDGPINPTVLPADAAASIADGSALMLVDVDPDSAEYGTRWPITWRVGANATQYLPANTLAVRLVEGAALRPRTTYALVTTPAAATAAADFAATLGSDAPGDDRLAHAWTAHAPLRAWIADTGIEVSSAAVFTTQDSVGELFTARDYMHTLPPPAVETVESQGPRQGIYELFTGTYRAPRFQQGQPPYRTPATGPGTLDFGPDGNPIVQGEEELRFALSVPIEGEIPPGGWPVVLYGHGTGGDYLSFISAKVAATLAQSGIAVLSIDQIHHGPRDPREQGCQQDIDYAGCVGISFFNFIVPGAGRDNVRQSALDFVSLLRLAQNFEIAPEVSTGGAVARLDGGNVMYMGHSQGGINGPLFLAVEPLVKGGMLSAAGATIAISIEQKRRPVDIPALIEQVLPLGDNDVVDRWHPTLMLLQTFIEKGDPVNYARFWFDEPPPGFAPKSIFMTGGLDDDYTPPDAIFALAAAGRVPIVEPVVRAIELFDLLGIGPAGGVPYGGNVGGGAASAGLAQYSDLGHFIIQNSMTARARYQQFLRSVADDDPRIY